MNIPLDRLYHYIENIAQEIYSDRIIIYRFYPNGSKNINELNNLHNSDVWLEKTIHPLLWCNDQEPLDYEFYKTNLRNRPDTILGCFLPPPKNLNYRKNIFEKNLLLHSEKRSDNLKKYLLDGELISVYYWSHAVIARDWFRYAEHVEQKKQVNRTFLIYNRAWSNTREYRLKFSELLIRLELQNLCKTSVNPIEPELNTHYKLHHFKNPIWRPHTVLENFFTLSDAHSHYSADFDINDYESTDIEVVLETLFDDNRLHLTEKSLRPIACAQPFIVAGTHGSLEYLRSYGFKTFEHIWNESYDLIEDPYKRLNAVADLMKQITTWLPHQRENNMAQARAIAEYNQQHFFSKDFFNLVVNELKTNLKSAFNELDQCNNYTTWAEHWKKLIENPELNNFLITNQDVNSGTKEQFNSVFRLIKNKLNNQL